MPNDTWGYLNDLLTANGIPSQTWRATHTDEPGDVGDIVARVRRLIDERQQARTDVKQMEAALDGFMVYALRTPSAQRIIAQAISDALNREAQARVNASGPVQLSEVEDTLRALADRLGNTRQPQEEKQDGEPDWTDHIK